MAVAGIASLGFAYPFSVFTRYVEWKWPWYEVVVWMIGYAAMGIFLGFFYGALGGAVFLLVLNKLLQIKLTIIAWPIMGGGVGAGAAMLVGSKDPDPIKNAEFDKPAAVKALGPLPATAYLQSITNLRSQYLP